VLEEFTDNSVELPDRIAKMPEEDQKIWRMVRSLYKVENKPLELSESQVRLFKMIFKREHPRNHVMTPTQFGKSLIVALAVLTRVSIFPEKWCIVAPSQRKAKIIMDYIIQHTFDNEFLKQKLDYKQGKLERLRRERSSNRLTFSVGDNISEVFILSAEARRRSDVEEALMGFGSPNIIEDESGLISDKIHTTVMRMLGGYKDNFLCKIGNPFRRNHFLKSFKNDKYKKFVVDWREAVADGRFPESFIEEMRQEAMFDVLYECKFPEAGVADESGWIPLFRADDIKKADNVDHFGQMRIGADIADSGANCSVIIKRSGSGTDLIFRSPKEDQMDFVGKIILSSRENNNAKIFIDRVGVGAGTLSRLRELGHDVIGVNAGEKPSDPLKYANKRAEMFWRLKQWVQKGVVFSNHDYWDELLDIKYKPDSSGRIKIMPKERMLREGIASPDVADALSLTFYFSDRQEVYMSPEERQFYKVKKRKARNNRRPSGSIKVRQTSY